MEKEFIGYNEALDLKELGFDEPCLGLFSIIEHDDIEIGDFYFGPSYATRATEGRSILAPTFSQAFRWFREKYAIYANINYDWNDEVFRITIMQQNSDKSCRVTYLKEGEYIKEFRIYEEAELECLKKLIEKCKNN